MKRILSFIAVMLLALTLVACKKTEDDPAQAKLDHVHEGLDALIADPSSITSGFELPATFQHGVTGTWVSSEPGVLSISTTPTASGRYVVTVNRPPKGSGNTTVTLSIELKIDAENSDDVLTKSWTQDLTIIESATEDLNIETIADILALADDAYDPADDADKVSVTLDEVTVFAKGNVTFVYDGTGIIQVYNGAASDMEVGKVYKISGLLEWYFGIWEIINSTAEEVTSATPTIPEKEVITDVTQQIKDMNADGLWESAAGTAKDGNMEPIYATVTGVVHVRPDLSPTDNYNTYLVGTDVDTEEWEAGTLGNPANGFMFYYGTNDLAYVRGFNGLEVTMDIVIYTYRSNNHAYAAYYVGGPEGTDAGELSDEEIVGIVKNILTIKTNFPEAGKLELPTEGTFDTEITWDFKDDQDANNKFINLTTGDVTIPEEGRVSVKLVAAITNGNAEDTKEFEVYVGSYVLETISDALAADDGDVLMVSGVVTDKFANNTYGIQDETGSIALYTTEDLTLGRLYTIVGEKDTYNELPQLKDLEIENVATATAQTPFAIDDILDDNDELEKHIAKLVSINGLEVLEVDTSNQYGNITVTVKKNNVELEIRYDSRVSGVDEDALKNLTVGDTINYIGNLGWFNGPQLGYGPNTFVGEGQLEAQPLPTIEGAVTIAKFLEESEEDADYEGIIVAVITSLAPQSSFSMEDATGAIQFRQSGISAASADFAVGDVVIVTAKRNTFNGLIQAEVQGEYEVRTGNFVRQPFLDLDEETVSNNFLIENQSKIVKATDVEVVSVSADSYGTVTTKVKFGTEEVDIIYDNRIPGFNPDFLLSLQAGDKVNIDGATITVNNTARLMMSDPMQVFNDKTEDYLAFYAEINNFEFDENTLTENTTLILPATLNSDIDVEWTAVEGGTHINLTTGLVTIPDATATLILKAVFTKGDLTTEKEFEFTLFIQEELDHVVKFDFTQLEGAKGTLLTTENLVEVFNSVSDNPLALTGVADLDRIYQGNGSGGGEYENVEGVIKTGTGSVNGTMTLTFSEEITKVTLVVRGWGSTDTLTINGVKVTLPSTKGTITIDLTEGATVLNFLFEKRALIEEITFE